jgi:hypothetical protein
MTGGDGKPLVVVGVEEGLHEAAAAVVRVMYEEVVPDGTPALQLAQVCTGLSPESLQGAYSPTLNAADVLHSFRLCSLWASIPLSILISTFNQTRFPVSHVVQMCKVADMWDAAGCLSSCLRALAQLTASELDLQGRMDILQLLPDAAQQLIHHTTWVQHCVQVVCEAVSGKRDMQALLLHLFGDVHALLTSPDHLQHFRQLSFTAIKAWAGSDDLVVDSEDSMAVALEWWVAGAEGSKCSQEQLKELSGLLRVRHMSAGEQQNGRNQQNVLAEWLPQVSAAAVVCACCCVHLGMLMYAPALWVATQHSALAPSASRHGSSSMAQQSWTLPMLQFLQECSRATKASRLAGSDLPASSSPSLSFSGGARSPGMCPEQTFSHCLGQRATVERPQTHFTWLAQVSDSH